MTTLRTEFHCHTIFSKDSLVRPDDIVKTARLRGIERLIITDHNTVGGALAAQKLDPQLIIVGEEIMTTQGELLTAYVREELPAGLEPLEAIRRLRDQGAFISVSHPFDSFRSGHWNLPELLEIVPLVDAIEVFNSRCMDMRPNLQARQFAQNQNLAGTVGSDAHTLRELGRSTLILEEFSNAEGLKRVIRTAREETRLSSPFIHMTSRYATTLKKWGWVPKP